MVSSFTENRLENGNTINWHIISLVNPTFQCSFLRQAACQTILAIFSGFI
jgi:hypothetical protein